MSKTGNNKKRGDLMLYDYREIMVCMLLLPVVLNIILPLAMLVVWLLKQLVTGKMLPSESSEVIEQRRIPQAA
jgi:hypothetical protein